MGDATLPARLRVSQYFTAVLLICAGLVFLEDLVFGLSYLVAAAAILVPLHFFRVPRRYYYTVLLAAGTIWLTHLVRPLVLFAQPQGFLYPRILQVNGPLVNTALLRIAAMAFMMMLGMVVGYRIFGRAALARVRDEKGKPILLRMRVLIDAGLVAVVIFKAFLLIRFGVGFRAGTPDPLLSVLARFAPDYLVYGLLILYLGKYAHRISFAERSLHVTLLAGMAVVGLLQGSKAFIAQILLALFVFYLAFRGDFSIRLRNAFLLGLAGITVLVVSFPLAMSMRRYVQERGYDLGAFRAGLAGVAEVVHPEQATFVAVWITSRLIGFDGVLATEVKLPPEFVRVFALEQTASRIRGRLVPLNQGAGSVSSGQAVSTFLIGHPEELRHSGGVGLFAASRLMGGPVGSMVVVFLFGLAWAAYFSLAERVPSSDARFLLRYVGVNGIIFLTMSGNADYLLPLIVVSVGEILALGLIAPYVYRALR
ncbi:MAG: hypothetical protein ACE5GJ_02995 [Gemmatimonadota bacterium]